MSSYYNESGRPYPLPDAVKAVWERSLETPNYPHRQWRGSEGAWHLHQWRKRIIWGCHDCISYDRLCRRHAFEIGCLRCKALHRIDVICTSEDISMSSHSQIPVPDAVKQYGEENDGQVVVK